MITQLSCLIFGYMRHRRANDFDSPNHDKDQSDSQTENTAKRPDYISYFDPAVEYYIVSPDSVIKKKDKPRRSKVSSNQESDQLLLD